MGLHQRVKARPDIDGENAPTSYGSSGGLWHLLVWLFVGPPMAGVAAFAGGLLTACLVAWPLWALGEDARFTELPGPLLGGIVAAGAVVSVLALAAHLPRSLSRRVLLDEDTIVVWTALGRTTLSWSDVVRAFVTSRRTDLDDACLHVWTRWREVTIPLSKLVGQHATSREEYAAFLRDVDARLDRRGKHLERGVPTSSLTDPTTAVRYVLFWPHRRYLAWRLERAVTQPAPDHRAAPAPMAVGWLFRPAPAMALLAILAVTALVRFGTDSSWAVIGLSVAGVLFGLVVPAWNALKDRSHRLFDTGSVRPEELVGGSGLAQDLPSRLVPAPGCEVDLERGTVRRPDGRKYGFDDISVVVYGPTRAQAQSSTSADAGLPMEPWQVAVRAHGTQGVDHEIYHNASVDVIRHGDLDGGYAAFNWVLAREVARRSEAGLQLAQGRVPATQVGQPLAERLATDVVVYDPAPVRAAFGDRTPELQVVAEPDRFEAWGPLTRFPEGCATPPIYRLLGAVACLAMTPWVPPAAMLAGYFFATAGHDLIMHRHFDRPGFRMDREGVWVRGEKLSWEELEHATLLPVSPGPLLFAGPRSVLVAGYLGGTYRERAWLGCAAWRWIQDNVCEAD